MEKSVIKAICKLLVCTILISTLCTNASALNTAIEADAYNPQNLGYNQSVIARTIQGLANRDDANVFLDATIWNYEDTAVE